MTSVGVIGSGAWGTTLALLQAKSNTETILWEYKPERAAEMQELRENTLFLPGFRFPETLKVTSNIQEAVEGKDILILVTPSQRMRENVRSLAPFVDKHTIFVNASKGIEISTLKRMTEVMREELPDAGNRIAALSGPNMAREIAEGKPTAAVVAAYDQEIAVQARTLLTASNYRVYTTHDVVGVELGGALKNIIAICTGINDGMNMGDNAKAAFITRGLAELSRLGLAAGAHPMTFAGLAGIGDLIATCSSPLSRNHRLGQRIGSGEKLEDILSSTQTVAEGVYTTRAALKLAERFQVELPITYQLSQVLFEGHDPYEAIIELMARDPKHEWEGILQ